MSDALDDAFDFAFAAGVRQLDEAMRERGVSEETRGQIGTLARLMLDFIPYAIAQKKQPDDVGEFLRFAQSRGLKQATLFGDETVNCAVAVVGFLKTAWRIRQGFTGASVAGVTITAPVAVTLAFSLLVLDLLEIGNSCPIVQKATYEAFMRSNGGYTLAARRIVAGRYGGMCRAPTAPRPATGGAAGTGPTLVRP